MMEQIRLQHGFRAKGTDTALMGLQTVIEQLASTPSPLFIFSWDISEAFDSPRKNV